MTAAPSASVQRSNNGHGPRILRYCGVSAVNVTVGLSVLAVGHGVLGWPAVGANLAAWMVGTAPAYLLSRAWVWQQRGPHRLGGEVLTFWVIALVGLVVSSVAVAIVEHLTDRTVLVAAGNLAGYGMVWVAKYVFLDQVMWRRERDG